MAAKRFEKGSAEYNMFSELWQIAQKYYVPEPDSDTYHEAVLRDTVAFDKKYNTAWSTAFAGAITKAIHMMEAKEGGRP